MFFSSPHSVTRYSDSHRHTPIPISPAGSFHTDCELQLHLKGLFLEEMEAVMEKECSALGGLFQAIVNDMKVKINTVCYSDLLICLSDIPLSAPCR